MSVKVAFKGFLVLELKAKQGGAARMACPPDSKGNHILCAGMPPSYWACMDHSMVHK